MREKEALRQKLEEAEKASAKATAEALDVSAVRLRPSGEEEAEAENAKAGALISRRDQARPASGPLTARTMQPAGE